MKKIIIIFLGIICCFQGVAQNLERIFYVADFDQSIKQFNLLQKMVVYKNSIDILAPQAYNIDESGKVNGSIPHEILIAARNNKIKIMPLIVNPRFYQLKFHKFLITLKLNSERLLN